MTTVEIGPAPSPGAGLGRRAARGAVWSLVQSWGNRVVTTVLFVVLADLLGAEALGVVALGVFVVELGRVLVDQAVTHTVVQKADLDDLDLDSLFWAALATGLALSACTVLVAPLAAGVLGEPALAGVLRWLAPAHVLVALAAVPTGLLQRELRFGPLAVQRLAGTVLGGAVAVVAATAGAGPLALVALQLVTLAVAAVAPWLVRWHAGRWSETCCWRPGPRCSSARLRAMRSFATAVVGIQLLDFLYTHGDNLIVGWVLGAEVLGVYTVAYRVFSVLLEALGTAVAQVAFPAFARLRGDRERFAEAYLGATALTCTVALPALAGVAVVAPLVVDLLFAEGYAGAGPMLGVLSLIAFCSMLVWFGRPVLLALGRARLELSTVVVVTVVKLGLWAALARHGVLVALWAELAASAALAVAYLVVLDRAAGLPLRRQLAAVAVPVAAAGAMALVAWSVAAALPASTGALGALVVVGVSGALSYAAALALVGRRHLRSLVSVVRRPSGAGAAG